MAKLQSLDLIQPEMGHSLVGCILAWLAVGRGAPWPTSSSIRGPSPQALTLLGGAMFIAWSLRCPFLEECRQGSMHFWRRRTCLNSNRIHAFPKGISPKVNVIMQLQLELAYYDVAVQLFSHNTTKVFSQNQAVQKYIASVGLKKISLIFLTHPAVWCFGSTVLIFTTRHLHRFTSWGTLQRIWPSGNSALSTPWSRPLLRSATKTSCFGYAHSVLFQAWIFPLLSVA